MSTTSAAAPQKQVQLSDDAYKVYPGPVLVLAGPGTGKTYQLAKRIQFLTSDLNASADEIAVITFTQEAAKSMRWKLREDGKPEFVPEEKRPNISTMHSLGHAIIEDNLRRVGLRKDFQVVERDEIKKILFMDAARSLTA
jgi:superfamily I DNA/RNA helicase